MTGNTIRQAALASAFATGRPEMYQIIAKTVYLIERNSDGGLEIQGEHALSDLGSVPNVGDRISLTMDEEGATSTMEVVSRHLFRHLDRVAEVEWTAWFLNVEAIDRHEADEIFKVISKEFDDSVRPEPDPSPIFKKKPTGKSK